MLSITSVKNPAVLAARALQDKRAREESGLFLCDGEHMVGEALRFVPGGVQALFVQQDRLTRFEALVALAPPGAAVYAVPEAVLAAVSQVKTPQGIAATVRVPQRVALSALGEKVVLLENVQDPGNVGTILRTADAAGFDGCVLTPGCADPFSDKSLRATMGSVFRVALAQAPSAAQAAAALAAAGYAVIATVLNGENFFEREALPQRVCVLAGNEGSGLSVEAVQAATHRYRLPMRGGAESLNVAIATGIFLYELMNGRKR